MSDYINSIVDQMKQRKTSLVNVADRENSMLRADERERYLAIYTTVISKYESLLKGSGGVDVVLKNLEDYIVTLISALEKDPSAGERARSHIDHRKQILGEIGRYHTALRTLKDKDYTVGVWPSVLHEGSDFAYCGIRLRELLAYYWLAASDPQIEFSEIFAPEIKDEKDARLYLQASMENFVAVLAEIRREHNEFQHKNAAKDNPSCDVGTFGRIFRSCGVYNKLTAIPPIPYELIPDYIQGYIVESLSKAPKEVQIAAYQYLNTKLMGDEPSESHAQNYLLFVESLSNFMNVKTFLLSKEPLKDIQKDINSLQDLILKIVQHEMERIKLTSMTLVDTNFIYLLLDVGFKAIRKIQFVEKISPEILEYRCSLLKLSQEIRAINRLVDNELIRGMLVPEYLKSEEAQENALSYQEIAGLYLNQLVTLSVGVLETAVSKEKEITQDLVEDTVLPQNQSMNLTKTAVGGMVKETIPETSKKRFENVNNLIDSVVTKLDILLNPNYSIDTIINNVIPLVPAAPGQKQVKYYQRDEMQWAYNLVRILLEEDYQGTLLNDQHEKRKLFDLLEAKFNPQEIKIIFNKTMTYIQGLTLSPAILRQIDRDFCRKHGIDQTWELANKFFEKDADLIISGSQIQIFRGEQFNLEQYKYWKELAKYIIGKDIAKNIHKLHIFVVLTVLSNLEITQINHSDIGNLMFLCQLYFGIKGGQVLPFPTSSTDEEVSINGLAGHLSCLLTTLKSFPALVDSGSICFMSSTDAKKIILQHSPEKEPYLLRMSMSEPTCIVVSLLKKEGYHKEYKIVPEGIKETFEIEGQSFNFLDQKEVFSLLEPVFSRMLILGSLPLDVVMSRQHQSKVTDKYMSFKNTQSLRYATSHIRQQSYMKKSSLLSLSFKNQEVVESDSNQKNKKAKCELSLINFYNLLTQNSTELPTSAAIIQFLGENTYTAMDEDKALSRLCSMLQHLENTYTALIGQIKTYQPTFFDASNNQRIHGFINNMQTAYINLIGDFLQGKTLSQEASEVIKAITQPASNSKLVDFSATPVLAEDTAFRHILEMVLIQNKVIDNARLKKVESIGTHMEF